MARIYKVGKYYYIDYYQNGKRNRYSVGQSEKKAQQILKQVESGKPRRKHYDISKENLLKFEQLTDKYLKYASTRTSHTTYVNYRSIVSRLLQEFEGRFIEEITESDAEEYVSKRLKHTSKSTVNRHVAVLKHMYNKAVAWRLLADNPLRHIKKLKEPPGRTRYLKKEEISRLISKCKKHLRPIVITALTTGMRKGETLKLLWENIDFEDRIITLVNTKNNDMRTIPLNQTLYEILVKLKQTSASSCVFPNRKGKPYGDVKQSFKTALRQADISDFRFHDLRHTFASRLVMAGVDLRTVQELMGHKDIKMTMRYSHISDAHKRKAIKAAEIDTIDTNRANPKIERRKAL